MHQRGAGRDRTRASWIGRAFTCRAVLKPLRFVTVVMAQLSRNYGRSSLPAAAWVSTSGNSEMGASRKMTSWSASRQSPFPLAGMDRSLLIGCGGREPVRTPDTIPRPSSRPLPMPRPASTRTSPTGTATTSFPSPPPRSYGSRRTQRCSSTISSAKSVSPTGSILEATKPSSAPSSFLFGLRVPSSPPRLLSFGIATRSCVVGMRVCRGAWRLIVSCGGRAR